MYLTATHFVYQFGHPSIIAAALKRRTRQINGFTNVAQEGVQRVHNHLNRELIGTAYDQGLAPMLPEFIGNCVQFLGINGVGSSKRS